MIVTKSEVAGTGGNSNSGVSAVPGTRHEADRAGMALLILFEVAKAALIKLLTTIKYFPTIAELRLR